MTPRTPHSPSSTAAASGGTGSGAGAGTGTGTDILSVVLGSLEETEYHAGTGAATQAAIHDLETTTINDQDSVDDEDSVDSDDFSIESSGDVHEPQEEVQRVEGQVQVGGRSTQQKKNDDLETKNVALAIVVAQRQEKIEERQEKVDSLKAKIEERQEKVDSIKAKFVRLQDEYMKMILLNVRRIN